MAEELEKKIKMEYENRDKYKDALKNVEES
jgi:hypothetical protein